MLFAGISLLGLMACGSDPVQAPEERANEVFRSFVPTDSMRDVFIRHFMDSIRRLAPPVAEPLEDLYERSCGGVYVVFVLDEYGDPLGHGTAFLIDKSGIMITNAHVVAAADIIIVSDRNREVFELDRYLYVDLEKDIAVFRVASPFYGGVVLPVAQDYPRVGEETFAIGTPGGLEQTISKGIISGFRDEMKMWAPIRSSGLYIQTDATIAEGSSGGPLFNRKGEVIGITTGFFRDANLKFAVSVKAIPLERLLDTLRFDFPADLLATPPGIKVRQAVHHYFSMWITGDHHDIRPCYADWVELHFDAHSLSAEEAAREDARMRWGSQWRPVNFEPDWDRAALVADEGSLDLVVPVRWLEVRLSDGQTSSRERTYRFAFGPDYRIQLITEEAATRQ